MLQFGFIYPYLDPIYNVCPCFALYYHYWSSIKYHYLVIFSPNLSDLTICAIFIPDIYSSNERNFRGIRQLFIHGYVAFQRIGGYRKCCQKCSLCVYLSNRWNICMYLLMLYPVSNFVVTNAVVLVLGECLISTPMY